MEKDIRIIDVNMKENERISCEDISWHLPYEAPFRLSGFAFFEEDRIYRRLPGKKRELFEQVNPNLNMLSENTAGGQIAFRTNASRILLKVSLKGIHNMVNMTAVGQCGFDCYLGQRGERYKFYGITRFDISRKEYLCEVVSGLPEHEIREVLLNFPLYEGVDQVLIGLDQNAGILEPQPYEDAKKIVFYGTSITQGGCASRPGLAYPNILSRWLNRECINLGFSANGLGEPEMAEVIAEMEDLSLVVLDYEANSATNGRLFASLNNFIEIIRRKQPQIPILVLSRVQYLPDCYDKKLMDNRESYRNFQKTVVLERRKAGDENLHFLNGNDLWDESFDEYTVDGIHPTDLGFWKMAEGLLPVLQGLL